MPTQPVQQVNSFNTTYVPDPFVVHVPEDVAGVQSAVREAVAGGRGVAVESTGHGRFDGSTGAVLVATRRLTGVEVDPVRRSARISAGMRWGQVVAECLPHGLAPAHGSSSTVGVVGYTLNGGLGILSRSFGYGADTVLEIELVTSDGAVVRATPTEHADLFWAVRGGGGSFGVVTEIVIQLFPVWTFFGGGLFFHPDAAADVLPVFLEWSRDLPDHVSTSIALRGPVPAANLPDVSHLMHLRYVSIGDPLEAHALVEPLRRLPGVRADLLGDKPYSRIGEVHNDGVQPVAFTERSRYLPRVDPELLARLHDSYIAPEVGASPFFELRRLGGAMAREPSVPNCVGGRGAEFSCLVVGRRDAATTARTAALFDTVDTASAGQPILNFLGDESGQERLLSAFDEQDRARLVQLKRRHDPAGVFRHGHVIH